MAVYVDEVSEHFMSLKNLNDYFQIVCILVFTIYMLYWFAIIDVLLMCYFVISALQFFK